MLVKLTQDAQVYWNHRLLDLKEDDKVRGDLARYLNDNGHPVVVLDGLDNPADEPDPRHLSDPLAGPRTDKHGKVLVERPTAHDGVIDEADVNRSVGEVLAWVDGDPARALAARDAELTKGDDARPTLLGPLDAILGDR